MRYGFLIDHNRCIGCHACKEDHDVPLGVYRTWLKYIAKGESPNMRRYFAVLRCNHCGRRSPAADDERTAKLSSLGGEGTGEDLYAG